jgi:putative colanic acid biosynthesis glycosyltransferase WcaI
MRIVLLNQYYAPDEAATAQIESDLGAHLARAGHVVTAICSDRSYGNPEKRYPGRDSIDGVTIERVRTTSFGRGSRLGRMTDYVSFLIGAAMKLLRVKRPDAVVSLTTPPMIVTLPLLIRPLRRYRVVLWSMDVYPELAFELGVLDRTSWLGRILSAVGARILRSADVVVALGEAMSERLRALGAPRVEVLHNWADGEAIVPKPAASISLRREWGWADKLVILYSGNLGLAHEFETVLAAAQTLAQRAPNVLFAFVGVGPRLAAVKKAAGQLSNVEFRDYVERSRLGDTLTAADVHLVTLRANMSGLLVPSKIYGILAAGRPTIYVGPDEGEIARILREGNCGSRIANGDSVSLARTVIEYGDPSRREREGANARAIFDARFTRDRTLNAFQALLESLG